MSKKILLVMALPQENAGGLLSSFGHEIIYTGVGKVNAAMYLTAALTGHAPGNVTVINLGSAGSQVFAAGTVACATRFFERDMDATALGFALGQTPFEEHIYLENGLRIADLPQAACYTGDSFVTEKHDRLRFDIIDMEAYALAKVCQYLQQPFVALKFITDGADGKAAGDWNQAVLLAAERLHGALEKTLAYLGS